MYSWTHSKGTVLRTKTIAEFSRQTGMRYSNAKSLACGCYQTFKGWLSPKAPRKRRKRFQTVLVNILTKERVIVGANLTALAQKLGVSMNELWKVVNSYEGTLGIKGWTLESTLRLAHGGLGFRFS